MTRELQSQPRGTSNPPHVAAASFGKYRLIAELGHGGMADVFLAVAEGPKGLGFSKLVVIKRLRPNLAEDPEFIEMLVDEARIAARLNHPNAVQTYEIGEVDGQYFIAMEYLDGQPLSRIVNRAKKSEKPLPLAFGVMIIVDVLAGLHHAHELADFNGEPLGIVHRDVTPHNVFVTYDGQVKIVDFGIAKAAGRAAETKTGIVKGKVVYMAPEQAAGREVDRRADIFAAGLMLWEFLTGDRAWRGFDELGVMSRLLSGDLPRSPIEVKADVDPELDAICKKSTAAARDDRYATAEEMSKDLLAWLVAHTERPVASDVGKYVADLFADRRRETREVIEAQLSEVAHDDNPSSAKILLPLIPNADAAGTPPSGQSPALKATTTSRMSTSAATTETPLGATTKTVTEQTPATLRSGSFRSWARPMPIALGAAVVLLAFVLAFQRARTSSSAAAAANPPSPLASTTSTAAVTAADSPNAVAVPPAAQPPVISSAAAAQTQSAAASATNPSTPSRAAIPIPIPAAKPPPPGPGRARSLAPGAVSPSAGGAVESAKEASPSSPFARPLPPSSSPSNKKAIDEDNPYEKSQHR